MNNFFSNKSGRLLPVLTILLAVGLFAFSPALASWNGNPFAPGATLDPQCSPTAPNCTVTTQTLQTGYSNTGGNALVATDGRDLTFTFPSTGTDPNMIINLAGQGDFKIQNGGNTFATFSHNGNFGLGTSTPVAPLSVAGASYLGGNTFIGGTVTATGNANVGSLQIGSLNGLLHATAGVITASLVSLTSDVTGTLPISNGGTGSTTLNGLLKGAGTGAVATAIAGVDYLAPGSLSAVGPLAYNSSTGVFSFTGGTGGGGASTTTANTWSGLQQFNAGASTTALTVTGPANVGSLQIGSLNGLLHASAGVISASLVSLTSDVTGTLGVANGGTGTTTVTGLLKGAGAGAFQTAVAGIDYVAPGSLSATGPLAYNASNGIFSITQSSAGQAGYLSASDWNTFNNKISSSSLSATNGITYNQTTGVFALASGALTSTTTANTWSGLQQFNGGASTTALSASGNITAGSLQIGSLNGLLHATAGVISASLISLSSDVTGTLGVANGGTGSTTLSGLLKGTGTGALATAIAGVDYLAPGSLSAVGPLAYNSSTGVFSFTGSTGGASTTTANTWSGLQQFNAGASTTALTVTGSANVGSLQVGSLNGLLHATAGVISASLVSLTSDVTGTLGIANGGTGTTTETINGVSYYNGSALATGPGLVFTGGDLGVGTTSPGYAVDVNGSIDFTGNLYQNGALISTGGGSQFTTNGSSVYYNGGNLGLGTTTPAAKFDLDIGPSGQAFPAGIANGMLLETNGTSNTNLLFDTLSPSGSGLSITNGGFVGIGSSTPSTNLSVQGNALISGNLNLTNIVSTGTSKFGSFFNIGSTGDIGIATTSDAGTLFAIGNGQQASAYGNFDDFTQPGTVVDITQGTSLNPVTTQGNAVKITRWNAVSSSTCSNNNVDNQCSGALEVVEDSNATAASSSMQTEAITAEAVGQPIGTDVVGLSSIGRLVGVGTGIGTGAFVNGERDTTTGRATGMELRVTNNTNTDGTYSNAGSSDTQALYLDAAATNGSKVGAGISITTDHFAGQTSQFLVGIGFLKYSIASSSMEDDSSSTATMNITGTHKYLIEAQNPGSGVIDLGTTTTDAVDLLTLDATTTAGTGILLSNRSTGIRWQNLVEGSAGVNPGNLDFNNMNTGNSVLSLTAGGLVGIGSTTPGATFGVQGSGLFSGALNANSLTANSLTVTGLTGTQCLEEINGAISGTGSTCGSGGGGSGTVSGGTTGQFPYYSTNGNVLTATSSLFLAANGYVGVGTTSPGYAVDVNGSIDFTGSLYQNGSPVTFGGGSAQFAANGSSLYYNSGNIGIGTSTPWGLLSVNANALAAGAPQFVVGSSTGTNFVVASNGAVGIGTSSPANPNEGLGVGNGNIVLTDNGANVARYFQLWRNNVEVGSINSGNSIFSFSGGTSGSPAFVIDSGNRVGMGTTTPVSTVPGGGLALQGAFYDSGTAFFGGAITSTSSASFATTGGSVGIGTTTPGTTLGVQGNALFSGNISLANLTATGTATVGSVVATGAATVGSLNIGSLTGILHATAGVISASLVSLTSDVTGTLGIANGGTGTTTQVTNGVNYYNGSSITSSAGLQFVNGDLGIGTTSPGYAVDVNGSIDFTGNLYQNGALISTGGGSQFTTNGSSVYYNGGNLGLGSSTPQSKLSVGGSGLLASFGDLAASTYIAISSGVSPRSMFGYDATTGNAAVQGGTSSGIEFNVNNSFGAGLAAVITAAGNFGIGTSSPAANLTVYGTTGQNLFQIATSTNQGILVVNANGAVGIGTSSPSSPGEGLGVANGNIVLTDGGANISRSFQLWRNNVELGSMNAGNSLFSFSGGTSASPAFVIDAGNRMGISTTSPQTTLGAGTQGLAIQGNFYNSGTGFFGSTLTATSSAYFATAGGSVGIGTTSPRSTLTVTGSGCFSEGTGATVLCGTVPGDVYYNAANTGAYDVAENYTTSDDSITPGTIVALDTTKSQTITTAQKGSPIFGVISTAPGLVLGGADSTMMGQDYRSVALSGRVPVKVTMEGGPIAVGDRITISSTAGEGMKATQSGQTIGVALTSASSTGMVTVFIQNEYTLQQLDLGSQGATPSNVATVITSIQSESPRDPVAYITSQVTAGFNPIADFVAARVTALRGYFDEIFANQATVQTLCVGTATDRTCLTKSQLDAILSSQGITPTLLGAPTPPSSPTGTSTPAGDTSTTSADTSSGTSTDTTSSSGTDTSGSSDTGDSSTSAGTDSGSTSSSDSSDASTPASTTTTPPATPATPTPAAPVTPPATPSTPAATPAPAAPAAAPTTPAAPAAASASSGSSDAASSGT